MLSQSPTPLEVISTFAPHGGTIGGLLRSRAEFGPERPFLVFQERVTTYGQAMGQVQAMALALRARGVASGDRVAIMAPNSDTGVLLLLALGTLGAIAVPVNPELGVADAHFIFEHAGVRLVVCAGAALPTVQAAARRLACPPSLLVLDEAAAGAVAVAGLLQPGVGLREPQPSTRPEDTCLILYTSGTTGFPKGVMHSQRNFVLAGEAFVERMHLTPDDRLLVVLPLFHINALFYSLGGALAAGASLLIAPRFSASAFWRLAAEGGATEVNVIGAVCHILLRRPRSEFVPGHRLRKIYGAGMSAETMEAFAREFSVPTLIEGYGLTEVPGVCNNPFPGPHKPGTIGVPARHPDHRVPFVEMRIVDEEGRELSVGETGEIAVRSPITMQGYYRDPQATAAAFRDGWFLTGDLGWRDADGYYYFAARKKDIIRRRGENISGAEIDRVVAAHPKVLEAAAIAVPAELGEDEILVVAVPRPGAALTAGEIADWCARELAPWKRPRYFVQADSLPHTPTHRVAKFKLREDVTLRQRAVELRNDP